MLATTDDLDPSLVDRAQRIARNMMSAVEGKPDQVKVDTDAATLRRVADIIERLCRGAVSRPTPGAIDPMDGAIDGIRFWVAKPQFDAERARTVALLAENTRLRSALRSIAEGDVEAVRIATALGEPDGLVGHVSAFARKALAGA